MDEDKSVDLYQLFARFTFEVISEIAFGVKLGDLATELEHPVETAFNFAQQRMFERFLEPTWWWKLQRRLDVGAERELKEKIQVIDDTCYSIISRSMTERQANGKASIDAMQKRDLISLFLDGVSNDDASADEEPNPKNLRDIVVSFMTAGRDTTTAALSWFFYTLTQHPETEAKIRHELASKLPELVDGTISSPSMAQANELVYLEAVVKESMRLNPAVPSNIREALEDVVLCDGTVVKAGEAVSWSSYSMGRMPHVWGPDAKGFKPQRWIDATTGKLVAVSPLKFPLFNAGPRVCLGTKLAMMEIKITAASVLSKYHLTAVPDHKVTYRPQLPHGEQIAGGFALAHPLVPVHGEDAVAHEVTQDFVHVLALPELVGVGDELGPADHELGGSAQHVEQPGSALHVLGPLRLPVVVAIGVLDRRPRLT